MNLCTSIPSVIKTHGRCLVPVSLALVCQQFLSVEWVALGNIAGGSGLALLLTEGSNFFVYKWSFQTVDLEICCPVWWLGLCEWQRWSYKMSVRLRHVILEDQQQGWPVLVFLRSCMQLFPPWSISPPTQSAILSVSSSTANSEHMVFMFLANPSD